MSDLFFYNVIFIVIALRKHYIINTLYIKYKNRFLIFY